MRIFHARDLDTFVAEVDRLGSLGHPNVDLYLADFQLQFETQVNPQLDPFSTEYFSQQLALYTELSGRELDQTTGELTHFELDAHVAGSNPYNSGDVRFISKHTRTIYTCVMLANLPPNATVLDMGSGWGLSSEALAFCGTCVTAVDINPAFVELVQQRAARLRLPIKAVCAAFDTFQSADQFDLLLFYECLHHSVRPWETLRHLGQFVKTDGKIIFAGEPVNRFWWPHWGLRLDPVSVYCIRKFGWWESGWTSEFISRCFAQAGFRLTIYPYVGLDNGLIGLATHESAGDKAQVDLSLLKPFHQSDMQRLVARIEASRYWSLTTPLYKLYRLIKCHLH